MSEWVFFMALCPHAWYHTGIYLHPPMVSQLLIRRKVLLYGKARAHKKNSCTSKTFYDGRRLSSSVESNCLMGAGRQKNTYLPRTQTGKAR